MLALAAVALLSLVLGILLGWKGVLAPLLGYAVWRVLSATMRSMVGDARATTASEGAPRPVAQDERVLYWCEECGTEVVLVVRGSGAAPRHCGTRMHERAEILS